MDSWTFWNLFSGENFWNMRKSCICYSIRFRLFSMVLFTFVRINFTGFIDVFSDSSGNGSFSIPWKARRTYWCSVKIRAFSILFRAQPSFLDLMRVPEPSNRYPERMIRHFCSGYFFIENSFILDFSFFLSIGGMIRYFLLLSLSR